MHFVVIIFCLSVVGHCQDVYDESFEEKDLENCKEKTTESILAIVEHFKQPDPLGIPGVDIPEPYPLPDMKKTLGFDIFVFKNTVMYGLSKLRILYVNAEMGTMEVQAAMSIDHLQARGNYTMSTWLSRAQGPFTANFTGLNVIAKVNLAVQRDGKLRAQGITIDMSFTTIAINFENLDAVGSFYQGIINSIGSFLFDSFKPSILKEAYTKAKAEINAKLEEFSGNMQFPNSISPLDMMVIDVGKMLRESGMDPYKVKDYKTSMALFTMSLNDTWITGVSSIQRVGNVSLKMENKTAIVDFKIGTQELEGKTHWHISALGGLVSRNVIASFTIKYITVRLVFRQPLDLRKKIEFRDLDIEIGNIQMRCDGAGTIDYALEFLVNVFPNLLRYQIMDAIERLLKEKVQQELDSINMEELITSIVQVVTAMHEKGFKQLYLKNTDVLKEPFDEDEFFDF